MARFSFARCDHCQRLNIYGAKCVCIKTPPLDCDCNYDGNVQTIGPKCRQRIRDTWSEAFRASREIGDKIRRGEF